MNILNYLLEPYHSYSQFQITLELIAAITGVISVYFAIKKNILVYPIGIISTTIYTYLLYQWGLLGDMIINAYYTLMSLYGWALWSQVNLEAEKQISFFKIFLIFISSFLLVLIIYLFKFKSIVHIPWINNIDTLYTALFFTAMYLMANKKSSNWYFWILGNALAIPVFLIKGYGITAIQYFIFFIMAIYGLKTWRESDIK